MTKILILMTCFFHFEFIEQTIKSIVNSKGDFTVDVYFLENPSKYSPQIAAIAKQYNVKHFICNGNIACQVNVVFIKNCSIESLSQYDFIALTESDVVLDPYAIDEAIKILKKYNKFDLCSVDLHLNLNKYKSIKGKTIKWVSKGIVCTDYVKGSTGFQFILFRKHVLYELINNILTKKLCARIARGVKNFYGLSDTNLKQFCDRRGKSWVKTKYNKLDHIGWETALDKKSNLTQEYVNIKNANLKGKIRININYNNYKLTEQIQL